MACHLLSPYIDLTLFQCPCHLNGGVEAATTLAGALLSLLLRFRWLSILWSPFQVLCTYTGRSWVRLALLFSPSSMRASSTLWPPHLTFGPHMLATYSSDHFTRSRWMWDIVWTLFLQMMITVASFEIASNISQDSYGLVFGINTFLALAFQVFKSVQIAKVCSAHCSTSRLALGSPGCRRSSFVCHHAQNTTLWCFRPYKPYIFWKLKVKGYLNWYSQVSHTQIHKHKYTNTQRHIYSIKWDCSRISKMTNKNIQDLTDLTDFFTVPQRFITNKF